MLTVEILITPSTAKRGQRMLHALKQTAPDDVRATITSHYIGHCDWLILYGAGGKDRWPAWNRHRLAGKRTITWDIGYWNRERMLRVSVDDLHPQRWIYRMPAIAGREYPGELRDDYAADGPVVFACMGKKSVAQHGGDWDARKLAQLGPGVIVRPKPDRSMHSKLAPIEQVLLGASRVVCHHSNVAFDAIVAGVPHDCVDGAAAALAPTRDPAQRREFLDRLGAWQWNHTEASQAWKFLREVP